MIPVLMMPSWWMTTTKSVQWVVFERKTAQKSAWYELKIYFMRYELLVTGGVYGRIDEGQFKCFLESSKAQGKLVKQSHWIVLAPTVAVSFERDICLLQGFRNKACIYKWAFKSLNFVKREFYTAHPLTFFKDTSRDVTYFSLASYILYCESSRAINPPTKTRMQIVAGARPFSQKVKVSYWL